MTDVSITLPRVRPRGAALKLAGDDRLARLAAAGDRQAFAAIYERHHQAIYRYCRSILGNDEDAADALQNAMTRAMQGLAGERREVALKPWLYRIAHNESISLLRRRRPQATMEAAEVAGATTGPALEGTAESRERLHQLVADLRELPERQRGALLMRELSGLPYDGVAVALGISAAAAKQSVFEARTALHELSEGRAMDCESVRRSISDRDGRVLRGRRMRGHLSDCAGCRDFRDAIGSRGADLQALAPPLPLIAATGLLERLLGRSGDGPGGGAGLTEAGAEAALGQAAAFGGSGAAAVGSGGWVSGLLGASVAVKSAAGVAAVAATVAVGAGAAGIASAPGDAPPSPAQAAGQAADEPRNAVATGDDDRAGVVEEREAGRDRDGANERTGDRAGDDEPGAADAPDRGTRPVREIPARERAGRPDRSPARGDGGAGGDRPTGTGRPGGAAPPSGGGLPEPAEQQAGGQIPEQGSGTPGSQAPAPAPDSGTTNPPIPDRGAGSAPGADAPAVPDVVPDAGVPTRP